MAAVKPQRTIDLYIFGENFVMKTLDGYNFKDKRALIRVDFNVPLDDNFKVTDDTRVQAAAPSIRKILDDGGSVVLMSHLGRPKGKEDKFSLSHVVSKVEDVLGTTVKFAEDCIGEAAFKASENLQPGEVLLLENLRFYPEEKQGDKDFAKKLARHGQIYVNDAFGTAHREHASTAVIAQFFDDKCFGNLLTKEIKNFDKVMHSPEKPVTAILGGAKVSSKITVIENVLDKVDNVILGGGMMFTFIKAQGGEVGSSLVEEDYENLANQILKSAKSKGVNIYLPPDSVVADDFSKDASYRIEKSNAISSSWMGLDIGPDSITRFSDVISKSKIILWNGPMGVFEFDNFAEGTKAVGKAVANATNNGAFSLVGGGDSVAAAKKFNLQDEVSYVSTGGGAMLELLEGKTLPGMAAIEEA